MKKKLLILSQVFPPETNAGAKRLGPMASVLSKYYDVTVVTLKPSHPSPEAYRDSSTKEYDSQHPYTVKRTFDFHPHKGSLLLRTLREQAMALRLAVWAMPLPADIVITSPPSMFFGPAGLVLARIKGAKFVWDVRDITWGYAKDTAKASSLMAFAAWALEKYMLFALRRADLVVGASTGITCSLVESGVSPHKAITISNGISTDWLDDIVRETTKKSDKPRPVVTYAGLIGYNQNLGALVEVARLSPEVDFVLAGDGPELPQLKAKVEKLGVRNVSFKGYLNKEKLLRVYAESDILFAQARNAPTINATMMPVKLFEYMATGRPIVYAGDGIASEFLEGIGCAEIAKPEDPGSISSAISELLENPERMERSGRRGRAVVQKDFHRDKLIEELAGSLEAHLDVADRNSKRGKISRRLLRFLRRTKTA